MKYPFYVRNKYSDLIHDKLSKSNHLKSIKLFNALFNIQAYLDIMKFPISYNQDLIEKIALLDFL